MKVEFEPGLRYYGTSSYKGFYATYTSNISYAASSCPKSDRPPNNPCVGISSTSVPQSSSGVQEERTKLNFPATTPIALTLTSDAACQLDKAQLEAVNKECGSRQTCSCIMNTVLSEDNSRICSEYASTDSLFRNTIINCARRDCDEFQFVLVFLLLGGGGLLGGAYLCCSNGCSFRPKEDGETTEEEELAQQAEDFVDGLKPEAEEEPAAEVDCCDGIDDGEIGVLAQLAIPFFVQSALDSASEEEVRRGRVRVASLAACASLAKKLGLKLVLVVPLALQRNWIPVGSFAIDVLVLAYFGATGAYCPGSLYNDLHVLLTGRRFVRAFRWRRFSLWMKFFVGFQGYSSVLGTAAQLATFACLSLRLYVGRETLSSAETQDLALAAVGLLNIKGASISCFAGLLFVDVVTSFLSSRCQCAKFHSMRGTLGYNMWKLIYERIETSSTNDLLKLLAKYCDCKCFAPKRVPERAAQRPPVRAQQQQPEASALAALAVPAVAAAAPALAQALPVIKMMDVGELSQPHPHAAAAQAQLESAQDRAAGA
jgi:hypothetical protein